MIQLKLRTEYSFGQTFAPTARVVQRLKELGCTAAGIVDRSTWGHVPFHKACTKEGIKPILGLEVVVSDSDDETPRMWLLARNREGLGELYRVASKSHLQQIPTRSGRLPRLYRSDVSGLSDDILKFAGDILDGEFLKSIGAYLDLSPASRILNIKKGKIAEEYGLPLVSTSDNSFCYPDDKEAFELISKAGLRQTPQFILPELEHQDVALQLAESCEQYELPKAPMIHMEGDLELICRDGIKFRKMESSWNDEYESRLKYELELIKSKDFESYFIVVADMVHYAKQHMLVGPSRGSAAGSLVCYLARITEMDPIPNKLFFERFISMDRMDLPDIDLDFPDDKRHLVFEYMSEKWGHDHVARIGNINRFKPRSALIQVCKALNIPPSATHGVKTAMIERSSGDARASNCLEDTFETTQPGKNFISDYPQARIAQTMEGHASHTGIHAAGLLVCNDEITNYCVVDGEGIAHVEKGAAEDLGLLKIDVLGLRTLGILEDSGVPIDWYNLKFDDPKTFDIFTKGLMCGIFQFEGNAMKSISEQIKDFHSLADIDAVTALARPGPFAGGITHKWLSRRKGEPYESIHPVVMEHMSETYGLPIYQEQTMAIVREIGGFSWKETAEIRKAMSKRLGVEFFNKFWERFKIGAAAKGIEEGDAHKIWVMINGMGSWQMNMAHTRSYAVISYWCAHLKAHHPLEFAAANLRGAKDEESAILLLRELDKEGIGYIPFDLELSEINWSVKNGKLIGGFTALKGIGESKAQKLVEARNAKALTPKQRETIAKAENVFADIYPMHTLYRAMYDNPRGNGISADKVWNLSEITDGVRHGEERIFIAELIYKNPRNANEEVNVKKRNGKIETGQLLYIDFRFRDDTEMIGGRIQRHMYLKIGIELEERIPVGSHLLVRATFYNDIRYAFVQKYKVLYNPNDKR